MNDPCCHCGIFHEVTSPCPRPTVVKGRTAPARRLLAMTIREFRRCRRIDIRRGDEISARYHKKLIGELLKVGRLMSRQREYRNESSALHRAMMGYALFGDPLS